MREIVEVVFNISYLVIVTTLSVMMIRRSEKGDLARMYGMMGIVLGGGDAFHLIPRIYGFFVGMDTIRPAVLGVGKLITSVTMTIFYVILYFVWRRRYAVEGKAGLTWAVLGLAVVRIGLCMFPQNEWLLAEPSYVWGIIRNVPFAMMGLLIIVLFFRSAREAEDDVFSKMWLAITLSFAFYIPVVLFVKDVPLLGMLMLPKTIAYVWVVAMGMRLLKE